MNNFIALQDVSDEIGVDLPHLLKECVKLDIPLIINVSDYETITTDLSVDGEANIEHFKNNQNTHSQIFQFNRWCGAELISEQEWFSSEYVLYGYWVLSNSYISTCLRNKQQPFLKTSSLSPYCENGTLPIRCNSFDIIQITPVLLIENDKRETIVDLYFDGAFQKTRRKYSYFSQSVAQKERHAAKRESVLMAAIALHRKEPNICSKNAKQWGELLWKKRSEFWADGNAPLSEDEIIKLLRRALKFGAC